MKRYSQHAVRDFESDIIMHQYAEVSLPSGLILPQHISTVSVEREINVQTMISMSGCGLYYDPIAERTEIGERHSLGFSMLPQEPGEFRKRSSQMITGAYRALTYRDVPPRIQFQFVQDAGSLADDDRATMDAIAQAVHNSINQVDEAPVQDGLYL